MVQNIIKTLLIHSSGFRWQAFVAGTALGVCGYHPGDPLPYQLHRSRRHHQLFPYRALSYVNDWLEACCRSARLDIQLCDITDVIRFVRTLKRISEFDLIIILHSATGDNVTPLLKSAPLFDRRKGPVVCFVGNEYDQLKQKIAFLNAVECEYVCSQLPMTSALQMYRGDCPKSTILEMPAALNPDFYFNESRNRPVDIGFIGAKYHPWIGDSERTRMIQYFLRPEHVNGLKCDIRFKTVPRKQWAAFLNRCRGIVGAESGTYFLDARGKAISMAKASFKENPSINMKDLVGTCFSPGKKFFSGKCISSRHFEPIGTGTCQILLEGHYNGILVKDQHYISVKKDLSNIELALEQFKDEEHRRRIVRAAYDHVIHNHTYDHRIRALIDLMG